MEINAEESVEDGNSPGKILRMIDEEKYISHDELAIGEAMPAAMLRPRLTEEQMRYNTQDQINQQALQMQQVQLNEVRNLRSMILELEERLRDEARKPEQTRNHSTKEMIVKDIKPPTGEVIRFNQINRNVRDYVGHFLTYGQHRNPPWKVLLNKRETVSAFGNDNDDIVKVKKEFAEAGMQSDESSMLDAKTNFLTKRLERIVAKEGDIARFYESDQREEDRATRTERGFAWGYLKISI